MGTISVAKSLDLLLLRPSVTIDDVVAGCELAAEYHLAAVQVFPAHVAVAVSALRDSDTRVCAAIGFPYGQDTIPAKLVSIEQAQSDGADEMAVMLQHGTIASGHMREALAELEHLLTRAWFGSLTSTRGTGQLTVVLETMAYDLDRIAPLLDRLADSPVGFVQTSSGALDRSVTPGHLTDLRRRLPEDVLIRAVGGVADLATSEHLLAAGAVRVGSASAAAIAAQERRAELDRNS